MVIGTGNHPPTLSRAKGATKRKADPSQTAATKATGEPSLDANRQTPALGAIKKTKTARTSPDSPRKRVRITDPPPETIEKNTSPLDLLAEAATAALPRAARAKPKSKLGAGAALLLGLGGAAAHDAIQRSTPLPYSGLPPQFEREITLPVPQGFVWPKFYSTAMHEHSGNIREAQAELHPGEWHCSVADRRTMRPPGSNAYHIIADVKDFVEAYPHALGIVTSHVSCDSANNASHSTWAEKIENGTMLRAALDFVWTLSLGAVHVAEQPPSAFEMIVGPASLSLQARDYGARRFKIWKLWYRGLDPIEPPTSPCPPDLHLPRLSGHTPEASMLRRSHTEAPFAKILAKAISCDPWSANESDRPANRPCSTLPAMQEAVRHNFTLLAARYSPTVALSHLADPERKTSLIIPVPIATYDGELVALVPLGGSSFGAMFDPTKPIQPQFDAFRNFLPSDEPAEQAYITRGTRSDYVCALPCSTPPAIAIDSLPPNATSNTFAWCTLSALQTSPAYDLVCCAIIRMRRHSGPNPLIPHKIGIWETARPLVSSRATAAWEQAAPLDNTQAAWESFLRDERHLADRLRELLIAEGPDAATFAADVRSAHDLADELPIPIQGLPTYDMPFLRDTPYPERPAPLITKWLTNIPPQHVPPGTRPMRWEELIRGWARRVVCDSLNMQRACDLECWQNGESNAPRPGDEILGPGAFKLIKHADGVGSYISSDIIWERTQPQPDGSVYYEPMDFNGRYKEHKDLAFLYSLFGHNCSDKELFSLLFDGVRFKISPPRQIRMSRNVESLKSRVSKIADSIHKLIQADLLACTPLCPADGRLSTDGPGPLIYIPQYQLGGGAVDKPDNLDEARLVGNSTSPHTTQTVRERNKPHGEPDGDVQVSFNDMTGLKKYPKEYDGPPPAFPDPERKTTVREAYKGDAILLHLAHLNSSALCGFKDDVKWMFFQFYLHPSQRWMVGVMYLILPITTDGVSSLFLCAISPKVLNMGTRPASKIACRFAEEFLDAWRERMDTYVNAEWLPRQTAALQSALAHRRDTLGAAQARPYYASLFTDDFTFRFIGPALTAVGARLWRRQCRLANLWMSSKINAGTILDNIGSREVLNAGFGCMTPSKRAKCIDTNLRALDDKLTKAEFISNNSYTVHVHDLINLPLGALKGIWAPTKPLTHDDAIVVLSNPKWTGARASIENILDYVRSRPIGPFLCATTDAPDLSNPEVARALMFVHGGSDACTPMFDPNGTLIDERGAKDPSIYGGIEGVHWRLPLTGKLALKHVTLLEALGPAINVLEYGEEYAGEELVLGSDATSALAATNASANSDNLITLGKLLREQHAYKAIAPTLWLLHEAGRSNELYDAGSRGKPMTVKRLAAAYNIKLAPLRKLKASTLEFVETIVNSTSDEGHPALRTSHKTSSARSHLGAVGAMLLATPAEATSTSATHQATMQIPQATLLLIAITVVLTAIFTIRQFKTVRTPYSTSVGCTYKLAKKFLCLVVTVAIASRPTHCKTCSAPKRPCPRCKLRICFKCREDCFCDVDLLANNRARTGPAQPNRNPSFAYRQHNAPRQRAALGSESSSSSEGETMHIAEEPQIPRHPFVRCECIHYYNSAITDQVESSQCINITRNRSLGEFIESGQTYLELAICDDCRDGDNADTCACACGGCNPLARCQCWHFNPGRSSSNQAPIAFQCTNGTTYRNMGPLGLILCEVCSLGPTRDRCGCTCVQCTAPRYPMQPASSPPVESSGSESEYEVDLDAPTEHSGSEASDYTDTAPSSPDPQPRRTGLLGGAPPTSRQRRAMDREAMAWATASSRRTQSGAQLDECEICLEELHPTLTYGCKHPQHVDTSTPCCICSWPDDTVTNFNAYDAWRRDGDGHYTARDKSVKRIKRSFNNLSFSNPGPALAGQQTIQDAPQINMTGYRKVSTASGRPQDNRRCECIYGCVRWASRRNYWGERTCQRCRNGCYCDSAGGVCCSTSSAKLHTPPPPADQPAALPELGAELECRHPLDRRMSMCRHEPPLCMAYECGWCEHRVTCPCANPGQVNQPDLTTEPDTCISCDEDNDSESDDAEPSPSASQRPALRLRGGGDEENESPQHETPTVDASDRWLDINIDIEIDDVTLHWLSVGPIFASLTWTLPTMRTQIEVQHGAALRLLAPAGWRFSLMGYPLLGGFDHNLRVFHLDAVNVGELNIQRYIPSPQLSPQNTHSPPSTASDSSPPSDDEPPTDGRQVIRRVTTTMGELRIRGGGDDTPSPSSPAGMVPPGLCSSPRAPTGPTRHLSPSDDEPAPMVSPARNTSTSNTPARQVDGHNDGPSINMFEPISAEVRNPYNTGALRSEELAGRSPQPTSAAAARRLAAVEMANSMADDQSAHAILPHNPDRLRSVMIAASTARIGAIPAATRKQDSWGFNAVMRFAIAFDTPWMRPRVILPRYRTREAMFMCLFLVSACMTMKPCSRSVAKGIDHVKPDSPLQALYAWRRVQRDCGRELADLALTSRQLKAERLQIQRMYGDHALVPQRGIALSPAHVQAVLDTLTSMVMCNHPCHWSITLNTVFLMLITYLLVTGTRLDELCPYEKGDNYLTRGHFELWHGGNRVDITETNLNAALTDILNAWYVCGRSTSSKCDSNNTTWGGRRMWFAIRPGVRSNFGYQWASFERAYPCPPEQRNKWPAFSPDGNAAPFSRSRLGTRHHELMERAVGKIENMTPTVHWWRVRLACALLAMKKPPEFIQMILRWKTLEAMQIYAKISPHAYASAVEESVATDGSHLGPESMPVVDPFTVNESLGNVISQVDLDINVAAKRPRHTADTEQPPAAARPTNDGQSGSSSTAPVETQHPPSFTVEIGPPLGTVLVDPLCMLGGGRVRIHNSAWETKAEGYTWCTIQGYCTEHQQYIVLADDDDNSYGFTPRALSTHLTDALRKRLKKSRQ